MSFSDIFVNYLDMALTGFIGGLVVYLMCKWDKKIKNKLILAWVTFSVMAILVLLYSFFVWLL